MYVAPLGYVAVILLAVEMMVLLLIPLAVIGGMWYGVRWSRRKLAPLFAQARKYLALIHGHGERASAALVAPLIAAHVFAAQMRAWWITLTGFFQGENSWNNSQARTGRPS